MHQGERRLLWIEICKLENYFNQNQVLPPSPKMSLTLGRAQIMLDGH